ncbi:kinase-like domain-containing protein, partial [Pelagophyceae sp. CCMP2097]
MEVLHHDLRRVAKKHKSSTTPQPFGLGGLPLETMQLYTGQLFHALKHVHAAGLVHLDVKPDNVVLDAARGRCVLCDFGSAAFVHDLQRAHKKAPSAYVQSRFYRAPEVPLGVGPLTGRADVWALGVTLAEVATGRLMLTGRDNHALLRATVSALGPPPSGLVDRGRHSDKHFIAVHPAAGATGYALRRRPGSSEHDSATKAPARPLSLVLAMIPSSVIHSIGRIAAQFLELIERTLSWDPDRRISADDALKFAFVRPA